MKNNIESSGSSVLSQKISQSHIMMKMRKFFMSKLCVGLQLAFSVITILLRNNTFLFGKYVGEAPIVYGIMILILIDSLVLFVCDDIIATTPSFLFIAVISVKCYDSFDTFIKFWWLAIPLAAGLIFHFLVYHRDMKLVKGKLLLPYLLVSVSVTLGGLGKISFREFFQGTFLFYTFGLGFGMLLMYMLLSSSIHTSNDYSLRMRLSYMMMAVGILCSFMVIHQYIMYFDTVVSEFRILYMQWRNNISTFLMLAMPFAFYVSARDKKHIYFYLGLTEYAAILLSGSRGGAMFGTIEMSLCIIVLIYTDKKNRNKNLAVIAALAIIGCTFARTFLRFFSPTLQRFLDGDSVREDNIRHAIQDFKSNIIFGRGFGRNEEAIKGYEGYKEKKMAVSWYHSSLFQIIGSFGLLGVGTFLYQFYARFRFLFEKTTFFNISVFISFLGLTMMSTVNPGEFCPVPYGLIMTIMFVICEKCNNATMRQNGNESEENIINIKI